MLIFPKKYYEKTETYAYFSLISYISPFTRTPALRALKNRILLGIFLIIFFPKEI